MTPTTGVEMSFIAANHFVVSGAGIEGTIDTSGIAGDPVVSLTVDGSELQAPSLAVTGDGVVVRGIHEQVPDDHTVEAVVTVPEVNLDESGSATCAGLAVLVTQRTSIGGPRLVDGPLQEYELRPLAVTASSVSS
jgi:hypothetical protein